jgi:hypothetical protein
MASMQHVKGTERDTDLFAFGVQLFDMIEDHKLL